MGVQSEEAGVRELKLRTRPILKIQWASTQNLRSWLAFAWNVN